MAMKEKCYCFQRKAFWFTILKLNIKMHHKYQCLSLGEKCNPRIINLFLKLSKTGQTSLKNCFMVNKRTFGGGKGNIFGKKIVIDI